MRRYGNLGFHKWPLPNYHPEPEAKEEEGEDEKLLEEKNK